LRLFVVAERQALVQAGERTRGARIALAGLPARCLSLGAQDKKIYVVPGLDLVIARHGGASGVARTPGEEGGGRTSFDNELPGRICRAVKR
ncbi:MAG: hypothetical protein ACKV2V_28730, partial [Blastocatellia bacterium]